MLFSLVFNTIMILFVVISILLIYSLLMISVEKRTFQNAIYRLLGIDKSGCIQMILTQSFLFSVPSFIFGYLAAIPVIYYLQQWVFRRVDFSLTPVPSWQATLQALALGILIPLLSSIVPINASLKKELAESLNSSRSKTQGIKVTITSANSLSDRAP